MRVAATLANSSAEIVARILKKEVSADRGNVKEGRDPQTQSGLAMTMRVLD